ncbi:hypothetical protein R3P38DRAFT_3579613 [Favolaschia claudopus]|uniref:Gag protein n=1 Tax=Favolaschia claudopus TaxID=2862362 RepID=A0AAW0DTU6_9AGAR
MDRVPPNGLNPTSLIGAKGAELKFWIIQTNEAAEKKVLNVSGTVESLRSNLASYYGFDLTVNPRVESINVPTVDESIRDRQWADLVDLGVEWKNTVRAGRTFKLVYEADNLVPKNVIESVLPPSQDSRPIANQEGVAQAASIIIPPQHTFPHHSIVNHSSAAHVAAPPVHNYSATTSSTQAAAVIPPTTPAQSTSAPLHNDAAQHEAASILDDMSTAIAGLERCEGLRQIIEQIESGQVKAIRDRYGPSEPGRRGTAHPSWSKYSNLVSKRERLYRVLTQDFMGDKERFFSFFSVPTPANKKRKRTTDNSGASEEYFRAFRKIVEAMPWCDADIIAEQQKAEYLDEAGQFLKEKWATVWDVKNSWEIWREIGKERYENTKKKTGKSDS